MTAVLAIFAAIPAIAGATTKGATVNVSITAAKEFSFTLSPKKVAHGSVTFKITNKGNLPHDFELCAANTGGTANTVQGQGHADDQSRLDGATLTVNVAKRR